MIKVPEKAKFITIKGPKGSLGAMHLTSSRIDVDNIKVNRFT